MVRLFQISFATEAMQRWFETDRCVCVLAGRTYEGVRLPSVYPDTVAAVRHAIGMLRAKDHCEFAYFIEELTSLNDRLASQMFAEEAARGGGRARIVTHSGKPADIRRALNSLLFDPSRPTASYSTCPEHCLTLMTALQNARLRVPGDAVVMCGFGTTWLDYAVPSIAHYRTGAAKYGRKVATMFLQVFKEGTARLRSVGLMPDFISGESVG